MSLYTHGERKTRRKAIADLYSEDGKFINLENMQTTNARNIFLTKDLKTHSLY